MGAVLNIKDSKPRKVAKPKVARSTKVARKVAKREQGVEVAVQRLRATMVRTANRIDFPVPTVLADALDAKGDVVLVVGETHVGLDVERRKGVVTMLRREGVSAWLDLSGNGRLCVRWHDGKGGYNLNCGWNAGVRPIVLDGATDPSTGSVVTAIVATTVGAFRQAFESASLSLYRDNDRPERQAMRLLPLGSKRGFLLASTDGSRATYAALPASGALKTSPILPAALVARVAGLIQGVPDVSPLSLVRSAGDDSRVVLEIRCMGSRIAEYVTDNDARFPSAGNVLAQARKLSNTATVGLTHEQLADAIGKRPKATWITISHHADGLRVSWSDPTTGDATVDVACDASVNAFEPVTVHPRYLLDAMLACGGKAGTIEIRIAGKEEPILVRGSRGMALAMPKTVK